MPGGILIIGDQTVTSRKVALTQSMQAVGTDESTTSTSYTNLATTGPAITLSPGVTQNHHLITAVWPYVSSAGNAAYGSPSIAGATALDVDAAVGQPAVANSGRYSTPHIALAVASGSTHTVKYRVAAGTGDFLNRRLSGLAA